MKKISALAFVMLLAFKATLEYSYITFIVPYFGYNDFTLSISSIKAIESYLFFIVITSLLIFLLEPQALPSKVVIYILTIFLYIPLSSLFWLDNKPRLFFYTITFSLFLIILVVSILPRIRTFHFKQGPRLVMSIFFVMTVLVYGMLILQGGLGRLNFNLLEVYDVREAYARTSNPLLSYLLTWQAHVVNMVLLALALYKKRNRTALIVIGLQLLLFAMTNFKSFLFAPVVLLFLNIFSKTKLKDHILVAFSLGSFLLLVFSTMVTALTGNILTASIFIRRLFIVPSKLHYVYYSFFENIEKYRLSHSFLDFMFTNKHDINPVALVARDYYGEDFAPNVGFFGDAYLNFGLLGVIIFSLILAFVLKVIDSISISIPSSLTITVLIIPSMALINSAFFTSLLTHGILFAIITLWLINPIFRNT